MRHPALDGAPATATPTALAAAPSRAHHVPSFAGLCKFNIDRVIVGRLLEEITEHLSVYLVSSSICSSVKRHRSRRKDRRCLRRRPGRVRRRPRQALIVQRTCAGGGVRAASDDGSRGSTPAARVRSSSPRPVIATLMLLELVCLRGFKKAGARCGCAPLLEFCNAAASLRRLRVTAGTKKRALHPHAARVVASTSSCSRLHPWRRRLVDLPWWSEPYAGDLLEAQERRTRPRSMKYTRLANVRRRRDAPEDVRRVLFSRRGAEGGEPPARATTPGGGVPATSATTLRRNAMSLRSSCSRLRRTRGAEGGCGAYHHDGVFRRQLRLCVRRIGLHGGPTRAPYDRFMA